MRARTQCPWTSPSRRDTLFEPINFGVVRNYVGRGGGGAIYLGLVKDRSSKRTRPTFLEQTDIQSLKFDFVGRTLTLARRPLLRGAADAVPLVDLRPLGAPVASYAVRVERLIANGQELPLTRPTLAVIDTGTTGLVISDSLYESDEFPLPGAAVRALDEHPPPQEYLEARQVRKRELVVCDCVVQCPAQKSVLVDGAV